MQNKENTSIVTKITQRLLGSDTFAMDSKRVSQHSLEVNQIDTPCDSGINSLNSKETQKVKVKNCFQADFSPAQGAEEQLLHRQSGIIDEDLSKNVKAYLSSDAIPKINASDHLKVRERADFINFTYRLIGGLRNCMTAAEGFSSKDNDYDQMKLRYTTLKWKAETVSRLLQEYKEILENTGGQDALESQAKTVPSLATSKRHSRSLNISPRKGVLGGTPTFQSPPLPALADQSSSLRAIESQIGDLSGALQLRPNVKPNSLRFTPYPAKYKIKISIAPCEIDRAAPIGSLSNLIRYSPLMGMTNRSIVSNAALHEWVFEFRSKSIKHSVDSLDAIIEACSDLEEWHFSSTECILPVEPGAALISDVASSKKQRKTFQLDTFLTAKPRLITIELSSLPSPYIEIEVKWLPLTQMDLLTLEKYPVPQGLMKEWDCVSNMEGSSQNLDCAKLLGKQRRQGSTNGREEEHDLDDDLDSMNSDSNGPTQLASYRSSAFHSDHRKPLRAEHNIYFSQASHNQSSDNSIFQQQTMNDEQKEEGFDRSEDTEGDNHCGDTIALEVLLNSVQTKVETINHRPNRYQALLCELSRVLQGLQEQLSSSSDIAANTFQCTNLPVSVDSEVEKSISMLDYVLGDSSAELVPDVGTRTQSLTSGWDQLDSVIQWHLHHVSHLIKHLESSNRFCSSLSHIDKYNNTSLLCINEDLLAMALEAQSEILVDITGLVLNCAEERNPYKIFTNSRCLAFCGTDPRAPLFPATFWSRYVWPTPTFGSGSPGPNETLRPNLMIQRTSLNEYLFQEYDTLDTDDENKQSLDSAIDNLIDKITDLDLMDITVWNEIPLTQLCNRLKLQNFQILLRYNSQNLRLGHPNSRGENSLSRSALNVEPIVSLALKYLIKQGKLQHELRESDEELLFHSLESLVNNLEVQSATADRRSELMALSVDNFICLAHTLEHKDDSVTASARQAICALENLTRSAYGVILQSNPLPFLRTAGPCCAFLKELDVFSQKLRGATSRFKDDSYGRGKTTNSDSGYSLISPVGTAILWAMQCPDTEDYRTAALAAWECFSPPTDMSFSQSSSRPQSYLFNHQPKSSRVTHGTLCGGGDQDPIKAEVRRMNLADDSAKVRRLALRILMSRQKCRSIACSLDTAV